MTKHDAPLDIGVDIDGVLYPFVAALRTHIANRTNVPLERLGEPTEWDFAEQWGMTSSELAAWMHDGVETGDLLLAGGTYPGAAEALRRLRQAGHRIHLITNRGWLAPSNPGKAEDRTRNWLAANDMEYETLTFSPDKTSVRTDVFIEDRPKNFLALRQAGVDAYLRDHPFNADTPVPAGRRVRSMTEFADRVLTDAYALV